MKRSSSRAAHGSRKRRRSLRPAPRRLATPADLIIDPFTKWQTAPTKGALDEALYNHPPLPVRGKHVRASRFLDALLHNHPSLTATYKHIWLKLTNGRRLNALELRRVELLVWSVLICRKSSGGRPLKLGEVPAWYQRKLDRQRTKYRNRKKT